MSTLVHSPGIVLRNRPFRESAKIATVLTKRDGRIDLLAHGARKPGSRFGAALEPGTEAEFIYYEKKDRDLWTLSAADIVNSNHDLRENAETLQWMIQIIKLLSYLCHPGEVNSGLYNLTLTAFNAIRKSGYLSSVYDLYLWKALTMSGYPPHLEDGCIACGKTPASNFSIPQGGLICSTHSLGESNIFRLSSQELNILNSLEDLQMRDIGKELPSILSKLIRDYVCYHLHVDYRIIPIPK